MLSDKEVWVLCGLVFSVCIASVQLAFKIFPHHVFNESTPIM